MRTQTKSRNHNIALLKKGEIQGKKKALNGTEGISSHNEIHNP